MNLTGFSAMTRREIRRFMVIPAQTILPPIVSSFLFILIFGTFLGGSLGSVDGIPYALFFVPGLVVLDIITSAYANSAFSLFLMRFLNFTSDILTAPLSYFEIVLAFTIGSVLRSLIVATLVFIVAAFFVQLSFHSIPLLIFSAIIASVLFSSIGLVVGLWAKEFEHLELLTTFLITPLTFLGGMFNSVAMLPEPLKTATYWNPFFYIINATRYSVTGVSEASLWLSFLIPIVLAAGFFYFAFYLFRKGYNLRS
ncbi:MAG: ABC transporter permease [Candidatus Diapherotrites archaeon]